MLAEDAPMFIAKNKAEAVFQTLDDNEKNNSIIIAADTVVVLENKIIGKPKDEADAQQILRTLSGKIHKVITAVVLQTAQGVEQINETTEVHFLPLTNEQIKHYLENYKPYDKAGAYAIQEWIGLIGIKKIDGDFYNVMGLPISRVVAALGEYL